MKKNNRGFLLAESLVVSTFVLTVLILLYIQFNNLTTNYKNSYNYNNVESIYDLSSVSNYLLTNNYNLSDQLTESKPYVIVYKDGSCNMDAGIIDTFCDNLINKMDAKTVIYTSSDISVIQKYVSEKDDSNINQKLREFISRVETNTVQNKGRLFAEFNNGTFATIAMDNEAAIEEPEISNVIQSWSDMSTSDFHSDKYKSSIVTATFVDTREVPTNATESWDVSKAKDGGVMAWVIPTSTDKTKYDLYIGADGGVKANTNSAHIFYDFTSLKTIKFNDNFDTSTAKNMYAMFSGCNSLTTLDLSSFDTSNVRTMIEMFRKCSSLTNLDISYFDTSNVSNMWSMFSNCESLTDIVFPENFGSASTSMGIMFAWCTSLTSLDLSNFNTSNVTNMYGMFEYCSNLTNLDFSSFDTSNVTDMGNMFESCSSLTSLDLSDFDTSSATNMSSMFGRCTRLASLDISSFNTSNVTDMSSMFFYDGSLTSLDLSSFNTSNVTKMNNMFDCCGKLTTLDLSNFNTSNVTDMSVMFRGCSSFISLDLRNFDTSKVTDMHYMFAISSKLTVIHVGSKWTTANADTSNMFEGCGVSSVTRV